MCVQYRTYPCTGGDLGVSDPYRTYPIWTRTLPGVLWWCPCTYRVCTPIHGVVCTHPDAHLSGCPNGCISDIPRNRQNRGCEQPPKKGVSESTRKHSFLPQIWAKNPTPFLTILGCILDMSKMTHDHRRSEVMSDRRKCTMNPLVSICAMPVFQGAILPPLVRDPSAPAV